MDCNKSIILNSISCYVIFGTILSLQFYSKKIKKIYYDPHIWLKWKNRNPWKNNKHDSWYNKNLWINKNPWVNKNPWSNKK